MGILLAYLFVRNMVDAVVLIPTLAHFLLMPDEGTGGLHPLVIPNRR